MYSQEESSAPEVTLANCDQEPVHTPGSIQPHGILIVLDENDFTIRRISANASAILGREPEGLFGQPLESLLQEDYVQLLREEVPTQKKARQNAFLKNINPLRMTMDVRGKEVAFNGVVHFTNAGLILELEMLSNENTLSFTHFYDLSRKSLLALQSTDELDELYQVAVREVQSLTGFN